tara:strand:+ start:750 stop:896 length:147 start_codon:yes stop_codon:yes gene_type:complete
MILVGVSVRSSMPLKVSGFPRLDGQLNGPGLAWGVPEGQAGMALIPAD